MIDPEEYTAIFAEQGTTISLAGKVYDFKAAVSSILRTTGQWHFKFSASKRFELIRNKMENDIKVRGEVCYTSDLGAFKTVSKKHKTLLELLPSPVAAGVPVAPAKINDVNNLLTKHFLNQWMGMESLKYYRDVVGTTSNEKIIQKNTTNVLPM